MGRSEDFFVQRGAACSYFLSFETECLAVYPEMRKVKIRHHQDIGDIIYDRLILAMGASQTWEWGTEELQDYLIRSKTLSQAQASLEKLTNAKTVAVIGAGQIGLESLDALSQLDLNLHVFEAQDSLLAKYVDEDMIAPIRQEMKKEESNFIYPKQSIR